MAGVQVAVIGSGAEHEGRAEEVGRLLASRGCTVVTGGLGEVIAVGGKWGTLAEIGFARVLGRPVVILEPGQDLDGVARATSPSEAVDLALGAIESK